jgi:hypothetical protein
MHSITLFFIFCSGSDPDLLKRCPTETSKYVGIGATIFFTGLFAALAGGYSLYTVFDSYFLAGIFGLLWGLMIFNLDRYIVSGMRKEGKFAKEFLMATPRIVLAILISIVIAKPLELKIFQKEIAPELVVMEQEKFAEQESIIKQRFNATQDSLKAQVKILHAQIEEKMLKRDELVRIAQQEADGTGGSGKKNPGPIYKIKKADADRAEREVAEIVSVNQSRIGELNDLIKKNDAQIATETGSLERSKINGPAARIEALDRLTTQSSAIWWAHWFIALLFIIIETTPVFVKLLSPKGPYDSLLKMEEDKFAVEETETLAKTHADVKERNKSLPDHEKSYLNNRLNTSLGK